MPRSFLLFVVALGIAPATMASAQDARWDLPRPEHSLLERLAGEWWFERQSVPPDGSSPQTLGTGTITAEMLGEFFVVSRWSGDLYGAEYEASQWIGYDIEQERYSGHWIDSFMGFRWELTGFVDEDGEELTLVTRGPAPGGGSAAFRERYRFDSADAMTIFGEMQQGESWITFSMTRLTRGH